MAISHVSMVFAGVAIKTPVKHLIVVVGENVTFDALYGVYEPSKGQSIRNLLSEGIVDANGNPSFNYVKALQRQPSVLANQYRIDPPLSDAYATLAQPLEVGIFDADTFRFKLATADHRFPANLPNGSFQITKYVPYGTSGSATGEPVLRFFKCGNKHAETIPTTVHLLGWLLPLVREIETTLKARAIGNYDKVVS